MSKSAKILLSKSSFYVTNHRNLSHFFSLKDMNVRTHLLLLKFFDEINFQITLLLKWCPIFDILPLIQNSKLNDFLWVCWFLYPRLKTPQPILWSGSIEGSNRSFLILDRFFKIQNVMLPVVKSGYTIETSLMKKVLEQQQQKLT